MDCADQPDWSAGWGYAEDPEPGSTLADGPEAVALWSTRVHWSWALAGLDRPRTRAVTAITGAPMREICCTTESLISQLYLKSQNLIRDVRLTHLDDSAHLLQG